APEVPRSTDYFVIAVDDAQGRVARQVAAALRLRGHSVVYPLRRQSLRKLFASASTEGAREVIVLGPEEVAREVAVVRDMRDGREREVPLARLMAGPGEAGVEGKAESEGGGKGAGA